MNGSYRLGSGGGFGWGNWGKHHRARRNQRQQRSRLTTNASSTASSSYLQRVKGFGAPFNAACTSGVLSALGDSLAQFLMRYLDEQKGKPASAYDPWRTLRMFGFGFCWYGPFQYYWYNMLGWLLPEMNTVNFLAKVVSNQLLLAPCTLSSVFAWNLALTDKAAEIPGKLKQDLVPNLINGWKFWVPAASLNFYCVPVQMQVLYMSCCGVLWTAYLSYASVTPSATSSTAVTSPTKKAVKR